MERFTALQTARTQWPEGAAETKVGEVVSHYLERYADIDWETVISQPSYSQILVGLEQLASGLEDAKLGVPGRGAQHAQLATSLYVWDAVRDQEGVMAMVMGGSGSSKGQLRIQVMASGEQPAVVMVKPELSVDQSEALVAFVKALSSN